METEYQQRAAGDPIEASAAHIRDYLVAMCEEMAELAAQIGRTDIEAKLREAGTAGMRPI